MATNARNCKVEMARARVGIGAILQRQDMEGRNSELMIGQSRVSAASGLEMEGMDDLALTLLPVGEFFVPDSAGRSRSRDRGCASRHAGW